MTHPDQLELLRQALQAATTASGPVGAPTAECLDDDTVAALAEGSVDATARAAAVAHVASCNRCRGALASVARALGDPSVAREAAAAERGARPRFARIAGFAVPAAVAALLLVLVWPRSADNGEGLHRAPAITAAPAPEPMSPIGAVAAARSLHWARVPGADRYRVTLFDAEGVVLHETEGADTVTALPDEVVLVPGRSYLWKVEARTGFGRWSASELVEFSIARSAPQ